MRQFPLRHSWGSEDKDERCKLPFLPLSSLLCDGDDNEDALFLSNAFKMDSFSLTVMVVFLLSNDILTL